MEAEPQSVDEQLDPEQPWARGSWEERRRDMYCQICCNMIKIFFFGQIQVKDWNYFNYYFDWFSSW